MQLRRASPRVEGRSARLLHTSSAVDLHLDVHGVCLRTVCRFLQLSIELYHLYVQRFVLRRQLVKQSVVVRFEYSATDINHGYHAPRLL